jgi:hypothetical protein
MTSIHTQIAATPREVTGAIALASDATGVDFDYLMQTAMRESSLESTAKARTSSAAGLFQFIDQTWLSTVKQNGADHGLGAYADAIETDARGRHFVSDPAMKQEILAERYNPTSAALMAGALTRGAESRMENELGRSVSDGELYMSHFLGTGGAIDFIQATEVAPGRSAADLFPRAASANKSIFYDETGREKSMREVYRNLISRHDSGEHDAAPALPGDSIPAPIHRRGPAVPPQRVATGYSRPVMELNPMVVNILASLEAPERDEVSKERKQEQAYDELRLNAS